MAGAWVRAPSIARTGTSRALCEAAASAAADAACLGRGTASKSLDLACLGRVSQPVGTGCARWLWRLAGSCCAEMLLVTSAGADKALGPMLPSSARELWPFCVLPASCPAAQGKTHTKGQRGLWRACASVRMRVCLSVCLSVHVWVCPCTSELELDSRIRL